MNNNKKYPRAQTQFSEERIKRQQEFEKKLHEKNVEIMAEFYGVDFSQQVNKSRA